MRIKEGRVLTRPEKVKVEGEAGRPPLPRVDKQVNRKIAMDGQTFAIAKIMQRHHSQETLSRYIRTLIWEDFRRNT